MSIRTEAEKRDIDAIATLQGAWAAIRREASPLSAGRSLHQQKGALSRASGKNDEGA